MADRPPYRWQACPVCRGTGCEKCKQNGAFVFDNLIRRWVPIPLAMVYPAAADLIARIKALEARTAKAKAWNHAGFHEIAKFDLDALAKKMAQAECNHDFRHIPIGDEGCFVQLSRCRKCGVETSHVMVA